MRKIFKEGHMAKVYIENNFVYKIYDAFYPEEWVDKEVHINHILKDKTSLNIVRMEKVDTHEIKMPYLGNKILNINKINGSEETKLVDFVHLQTEIHKYKAFELENAHVVYKRWLERSQLGKDVKEVSLKALSGIDYMNHLCHFDFQPSHVIIYKEKYYMVDWMKTKLANPILDIASTYVILRLQSYKTAHQYLYKVMDMTDYKIKNIYLAISVMAAVKMIETDDIYIQKVLTTLVFEPKNKDVTQQINQ